jgi:glycosidase
MKYWVLTANIDGFRCDAADFVPYSFWKQAIDSLQSIKNRTLILLAEGARNDHFNAGFQMNFSWDFYSKNKSVFNNTASALDYAQTHTNEYNAVPLSAQKLRFTSNHDECAFDNTPIALFGGKSASISAFVINSFMGGVPLIYNGQEVGCSIKLPIFSASVINWNEDLTMLKTYKKLMFLRNNYPALRYGTLTHSSNSNICAFQRSNQSDNILVLANTRNTISTYTAPLSIQNTNWKDLMTDSVFTINTTINLIPYQYRILQKQ